MYRFSSKLVRMSKTLQVDEDSKTKLAYYKIYPFSVHYDPKLFHSNQVGMF
jgi:hypothetical protein